MRKPSEIRNRHLAGASPARLGQPGGPVATPCDGHVGESVRSGTTTRTLQSRPKPTSSRSWLRTPTPIAAQPRRNHPTITPAPEGAASREPAVSSEPARPIVTKDIPTLTAFAETFLAAAGINNKPSSIENKESVLRLHILPRIGHLRV